jgi:phage shock protein E
MPPTEKSTLPHDTLRTDVAHVPSQPQVPSVSARDLVARGALLLDVRTAEEFAEQHLTGALNIPLQELASRLLELGAKDRAVVVYCRSGNRSGTASALMKSAGYAVLDIKTMENW